MKRMARSVLAHDPSVRVAHLFDGMGGEPNDVGIPSLRGYVLPCYTVAELHQCVLDMSRMLFIVQVFADSLLGKRAAKPSAPPKQERHQHDEPGREEKKYAIAPSQTERARARHRRTINR